MSNSSIKVWLIDIQAKDHQKIEQLYKKKLLKKKNVLTFGEFAGKSEADIEDMFDVSFYLDLVNAEYKDELKKPIREADLPATEQRVLVRIETYLQSNPLKKGSFNHYRPSRYFAENTSKLKSKLSQTSLGRFAAAVQRLNELI